MIANIICINIKITLPEMYELAQKLGNDVNKDGLKSFFAALDKDRSGTIDIQEFYIFWIWSMVKDGCNIIF
jgi:Ca2+-binding EF-hand superfamily protein